LASKSDARIRRTAWDSHLYVLYDIHGQKIFVEERSPEDGFEGAGVCNSGSLGVEKFRRLALFWALVFAQNVAGERGEE
jgi:hypothetical protein